MYPYRILSTLTLLSVLHFSSGASSKEIVVDDADTSILYNADGTLSSSWTTAIPSIEPEPIDATQVHAGTAHTGRGTAKASFEFTGVSISVYFVLPNITNLFLLPTFSIDGVIQPDRIKQAFLDGNGAQIVYNAPVFSNSDLSNGSHLLEITGSTGADFTNSSYFMLDYIKYTQLEPGSHSNRTLIIGISVAGCFVLVVVAIGIAFWARQRRLWGRGVYEQVTLENGAETSDLLAESRRDRPNWSHR
ncbi:hypothetical protein M407DRAFT_30093 [Tulasnella calospora MUT 4182]|uniref:Uncharacterized protein n=1 Tax=Tulasnella calospora MUT 4182 TaxID=1051891 RepID=A0A0C3KFI0_9AGAM|nr:hypothetical protein M407DRAFT_30093 [Tulasnella calospora MUT 4182]